MFLFFIKKNNIQENYITWFLPYYNNEQLKKIPKYIFSDEYYNNLKYTFTDKIEIYLIEKYNNTELLFFYKFIFTSFLKYFNFNNFYLYKFKNYKKLIEKINKKENSFSLISTPILYSDEFINSKNIKNINTIINLSYEYIFLITTINNDINSLNDINNKIINIGTINDVSYRIGNNIIENIQLNNNIKVTKTYYNIDEAFTKLLYNKVDLIVLIDIFPSPILNYFIYNDFEKLIKIIPFNGLNEQTFLERHPLITKANLNLNLLPNNYLPVKIDNITMTKFKPNYQTYRIPQVLICNKNTKSKLIFNILQSIYKNINNINKIVRKNPYNILVWPDISLTGFLPLHLGAIEFYKKIGIITNNKSDDCKYLIGKERCTSNNSENIQLLV